MIDLHCHLLPGIDDGPATMEESLDLARAAVAAGTTAMVCTPHVSWDYAANHAAQISADVQRMDAALKAAGVPLVVLPGAEIAMTRAAELSDAELLALRLGGPEGTHLLIECPLSPTAAGFDRLLDLLRAKGHEILLAHPERCPAFQRDPAALERLVAQGMLTQITAGALVGRFGRTVQEFADRLVRDGIGHDVSSDAHSVERRPPGIVGELEQAGYGEQATWLAYDVPHAVLTGVPVPPAPAMPAAPRRGLGRMFGRG